MNKFIITCCSTVDLTNAQLKKNNNNYIRFKYLLDGKEYLDDMEESISDQIIKLNADLEENCFSICPNEQVLCEILLDICYRDGIDVSIVWNLCGDVIVDKLLKKSGGNCKHGRKSNVSAGQVQGLRALR